MTKTQFSLWWWFTVMCSFLNAGIVFTNLVTNHVTWVTCLNGIAAIWLALLAGPYPIKEE